MKRIYYTEIEEYTFHQYKSTIFIDDIDINEIVVSNNFPLVKKILNFSLVTKIRKKLNFCPGSLQKLVYIKDIVTRSR